MTVSVRPWDQIAAKLRDIADAHEVNPDLIEATTFYREAAVAGDALVAAMIEVRSERDTAIAKAALCNAKLAAVHTALDHHDWTIDSAVRCVSAIAEAVGR